MAKAKLATLTEKWIDGKTEKQLAVKTERQNTAENDQKIKQTLYMSRKAVKLLGHNRAETGEPMSHTVEQLILNHIGKK
ncbi:MAG TPA: hypothetical protein DEA99_05260 [Candidatus Omnitrophica bacterium]|nr:hypothetical protein [Candidatus Omnitrophota bacterium]